MSLECIVGYTIVRFFTRPLFLRRCDFCGTWWTGSSLIAVWTRRVFRQGISRFFSMFKTMAVPFEYSNSCFFSMWRNTLDFWWVRYSQIEHLNGGGLPHAFKWRFRVTKYWHRLQHLLHWYFFSINLSEIWKTETFDYWT